jgi:hypothetical protein
MDLPEELTLDDATIGRINAACRRATEGLVIVECEARLGEPETSIEAALNKVYTDLAADLTPEDRLMAIVMLLTERLERATGQVA